MRRSELWVFVAITGLVGCGSENRSPSEQCETLVNDYCRHAVDCVLEQNHDAGYSEAPEDGQCWPAVERKFGCSKAVGVGDSYYVCITAVQATDCATWKATTVSWAPPPECNGAIRQ